MDPKLRELIKDWLIHVRKNNIQEPDESDLRNFLNDRGFGSDSIEKAFSAVIKSDIPNEKPDNNTKTKDVGDPEEDKSKEDNEDKQSRKPPEDVLDLPPQGRRLYSEIVQLIKKMTPKQRKQLVRGLTDG